MAGSLATVVPWWRHYLTAAYEVVRLVRQSAEDQLPCSLAELRQGLVQALHQKKITLGVASEGVSAQTAGVSIAAPTLHWNRGRDKSSAPGQVLSLEAGSLRDSRQVSVADVWADNKASYLHAFAVRLNPDTQMPEFGEQEWIPMHYRAKGRESDHGQEGQWWYHRSSSKEFLTNGHQATADFAAESFYRRFAYPRTFHERRRDLVVVRSVGDISQIYGDTYSTRDAFSRRYSPQIFGSVPFPIVRLCDALDKKKASFGVTWANPWTTVAAHQCQDSLPTAKQSDRMWYQLILVFERIYPVSTRNVRPEFRFVKGVVERQDIVPELDLTVFLRTGEP